MKRRLFYGLLAAALGVNLLVGAQIYFAAAQGADQDEPYPNLKLFTTVLDRVRQDHVDGDSLTYQELIYGALKGMLSSLDPHSEFMEPVKYDDLKNDTQGEFGGVGIVISMKDQYLTVVAPMEDTPGFKAGILSGDRIIKIDGKSAEKLSLQDAVQRLRGRPGTEVRMTIHRPSDGKIKEFKLVRAQIKIDTVKDLQGRREFRLGEDKIGYVRLVQFGEQTGDDLEEALRKLEGQGMQSLILDLRDNPGGLLDSAVKVCDKFLPHEQLVVTTEGRTGHPHSKYYAESRHKHLNLPLVVLVNNGSASASEIVAGCLQDTTQRGVSRAVILGERTFGKGSVQSILPLPDGSALRLTTAKYYTPSHKVIHERGITPDIVVPMSDEEMRYVLMQRVPGGLEALEPAEQEAVRNARDRQLDRAIDLLKGIRLYTQQLSPLRHASTPGGSMAARREAR
ncbi:MAG: S41 family peptidase [Verrucomicrobia bacterium]|nr:S41 family peptidase [Verrucomicrobiota bacterium]